jgi:hypothetical protein
VNDKAVTTPEALMSVISGLTKGEKVKIGYLHHGWWQVSTYIQF